MSKFKKIFLKILAALIAFVLVFSAVGIGVVYFCIIPQYNQNARLQNRSEMNGKDVFDIAVLLSDKQVIENLKNFDPSSAKDVLEIMNELEREEKTTVKPYDKNNLGNVFEKQPVNTELQDIPEIPTDSTQSAYERIMAAADKTEISAGISIMSKIDVSKINELRSRGKTDELKTYIQSRLTPAEISTALSLYNKYKNLL